ncbi:MAG: hypothetical protein K2W99_03685 [Chthoniobacterales bacterium]|nr:hypothetical protein [Chthoniobacterales bacterium]
MQRFLLLFLLSVLALSPPRVSAMVKVDKKEEKKKGSGDSKENLQKNTDEKWSKTHEETTERVNNPAVNNDTEIKEEVFVEEEDLFDLGILEQRIQEAREVVADLPGKGTAVSEQELRDLYQKWSKRYEVYQETLSSFLEQNNNAGLIEQQQNEPRLEKLQELSHQPGNS